MKISCLASLTCLLSLTLLASTRPGYADPAPSSALVVGWSDEFNQMNWLPLPKPNDPDTSLHRGDLKLSLGPGATCVPSSVPFYWASVTRVVDVDIDRYPILAVRAVGLHGHSWWDVDVQACQHPADGFPPFLSPAPVSTMLTSPHGIVPFQEGNWALVGAEVKTPSLDHDGIILFDLQSEVKNGLVWGSHLFRIRLNIAGTEAGGSVEYDWIRFIRRQDADRLAANPRIRDLVVEP